MADTFSPAERRKYLGCSEVAAALNRSPYPDENRVAVWERKTGRRAHLAHRKIFDRGHRMEPLMLQLLEEDHGRIVDSKAYQAEFVHPDLPWLKCHVDGIIPLWTPLPAFPTFAPLEGEGILELKAPGDRMAERFKEEGLTPDYIVQGQAELAVTGKAWGCYGFLHYDAWELYAFDVARHQPFIDSMLAELEKFWWHVQNDQRPEDDLPEIGEIPEVKGDLLVVEDPFAIEAAEGYLQAQESKKVAETYMAEYRSLLEKAMGNHALARFGDVMRVSWNYQGPRHKINAEGLMAYAMAHIPGFDDTEWLAPCKPSRTFRATAMKKEGGD